MCLHLNGRWGSGHRLQVGCHLYKAPYLISQAKRRSRAYRCYLNTLSQLRSPPDLRIVANASNDAGKTTSADLGAEAIQVRHKYDEDAGQHWKNLDLEECIRESRAGWTKNCSEMSRRRIPCRLSISLVRAYIAAGLPKIPIHARKHMNAISTIYTVSSNQRPDKQPRCQCPLLPPRR